MADQLPLDLTFRPALGREDFWVSPSNAVAVGLIDRWPDWPGRTAVLVGPAGSGKSHLVAVLARHSHARILPASELDRLTGPAADPLSLFAEGATIVVENVDPASPPEIALFHMINAARERSGYLLLTCAKPPVDWAMTLDDLRSRLAAAPVVHLGAPDDVTLEAVIRKLFADRGIDVAAQAIDHAVIHMERSFATARWLVREADALALSQGRRVSRAVIKQVLESAEKPS